MVGEACAYVQGESLKARAALLTEASQLPDRQDGEAIMCIHSQCLVLSGIVIALALQVGTPHSEELRPYFNVRVDGDSFPTVRITTNMPDGTWLFINVKKPWLPDADRRLARGLPACEDTCIAAMGPNGLIGVTLPVMQGTIVAGPFSFAAKPFRAGVYPVEISLSADPKTATVEQIRAIGTVLFETRVRIPSGPELPQSVRREIPKREQPPVSYEPKWQKVEADNGAEHQIDLNSARRFAAGVLATVYFAGARISTGVYFDCAGHMGELGGPMAYVPPRSIGARLSEFACAEANQHPNR